ncbi:MAG: hypothetical protein ACK6CU_22630 [Deltaproteobacteria bacterium]|jgi:hypothetical protein
MRSLALLAFALLATQASVFGVAADEPAGSDPPIPEAPRARTEIEDEGAPIMEENLAPVSALRALSDPFGLELRVSELDAMLAADADAAARSRSISAVLGCVIGVLGIGATPVFFALDDGSGLLPILAILPAQLGALSLATGILSSVSRSTEERRHDQWSALRAAGRPGLEDVARFEGFVVADADRARDARLFSVAQGLSGLATGLFTGIVGLAVSDAELTQITLGALGAVEILVGVLQLVSGLEAGEVEARPARYESRTGVRLSLRVGGISGSF